MKRTHVYILGRTSTHQCPDTLLHLAGRLIGKGQGQYVPGLHALLYQIGYLVRKHTGLARSGSGNYQRGAVVVDHGFALTLIEGV